MKRRKLPFRIVYGLLIAAFTVYVMLDTFVITRVYYSVPEADTIITGSETTLQGSDAANESGSGDTEGSEDTSDSSEDTAAIAAAETTGDGSVTRQKPGSKSSSRKKKSSSSRTGEHSSSDANSMTDGSSGDAESSAQDAADSTASGSAEAVASDLSYQDDNIQITISEYTQNDSTIYVADIQVSSAEYLKTALAQNAYGKNVTAKTSEIAEDNGAILAINGDYYGAQESGYVIRNGVLYRSSAEKGQEDLVIYEDGTFAIITEDEVTAEELLADGAVQVLSFGPALVTNGEIAVTEDEEVGKAMASNPRTAIGVISDLHYVFVVSDGRSDESEGLSLRELAEFMDSLGVETAYNLDGGGSSTMYFNGQVVNNPTTTGHNSKERSVSDIAYIGY